MESPVLPIPWNMMDEKTSDVKVGASAIKTSVCRLCLVLSPTCVSIHSDSLSLLVSCLPVHVSESDSDCLPPWACPECLDKMKIVRQFFCQIYSSYNNLTGGKADLYVKKDMTSIESGYVKQELEDMLEQKLEEVVQKEATMMDYNNVDYNSDGGDNYNDFIDDDYHEDEEEYDSKEDIKWKAKKLKVKKSLEFKESKPKKPKKHRNMQALSKLLQSGKVLKMRDRVGDKHIKLLSLATMCTCAECGEEFRSHGDNNEHWKTCHPDKEMSYKCSEDEDDCTFATADILIMKNHLREHMFKLGLNGQCQFCGKYYPKNFLARHILQSHESTKTFECKKCNKFFKTERILKTHELTHESDSTRYKYSCHICGQRFTQKGNVDSHLMIHSGERPFKCNSCDKAFTTSGGLKAHYLVHTGERPYACDQCEATFKSSGQLKNHVMEKHLQVYRYQCTYCPVKYNRLEMLRNHEMSHTGEAPFKCSTCGKGFRRKDKLKKHEILHGPDEEKYRYPCEVCGKRFTQNNNLKTHMKSHHSDQRDRPAGPTNTVAAANLATLAAIPPPQLPPNWPPLL